MSRDLLDLVRELNTLNDDNLANQVIENSDVQWCLSELQDILEEMFTLTPQNEPLTCEGCACESYPRDCYPCNTCNRNDETLSDQYRPPEGEDA